MFCWLGNYLAFYNAIRRFYPDIQIISNCDASLKPLDHPADLYDYHVNINNLSFIFFDKQYVYDLVSNFGSCFFTRLILLMLNICLVMLVFSIRHRAMDQRFCINSHVTFFFLYENVCLYSCVRVWYLS